VIARKLRQRDGDCVLQKIATPRLHEKRQALPATRAGTGLATNRNGGCEAV
jgi:hypothetical protein